MILGSWGIGKVFEIIRQAFAHQAFFQMAEAISLRCAGIPHLLIIQGDGIVYHQMTKCCFTVHYET